MENASPALPHGSTLRVFALNDTLALGRRVCAELGVAASAHEEREFDDGEHKARPLVEVRGCDVFVMQSLYGDSVHSGNDKLCRLLFFIGALKDAAAARVTAVVPYLAYARKDKRTQSNDPVTTRYVAALFEAVGTDAVITIDVHNVAAYQNAFRCPTEHLETQALFVTAIAPLVTANEVTVLAPDAGASQRANLFRHALSKAMAAPVGTALAEKHRSAGELSGELLVGDVRGRDIVIVDDLIASGSTLARSALHCRRLGARRVIAAATHGLFTANAAAVLGGGAIDHLLVTNTVEPVRLESGAVRDNLVILDAAPLLAGAIRRAHGGAVPI